MTATFGTACEPVLRTMRAHRPGRAIACLAGKLARDDLHRGSCADFSPRPGACRRRSRPASTAARAPRARRRAARAPRATRRGPRSRRLSASPSRSRHLTSGGGAAGPPPALRFDGGGRPVASRRVSATTDCDPREGQAEMVRSVAERAFVPARQVLEEFGDMMILTGKTIWSALRPPYPYGGEFVSQFLFALRLCWFPLLVSTVCICYAAPGLQAANFLTIFGALDRLGGFFVLGAGARDRAERDRDRGRGRRGHGDHRRPRRAQGPRGARRPAGARRRPGQEPRRPPLPGADARHGPVRHLRAAVRDLRRDHRRARQRPVARARSGRRCSPTPRRPTCGARC